VPATFRVPFLSLRPGDDRPAIDAAITRVLDRGWFILGPELQAFEQELAAASGTADAVGVGSGTDALSLILRGLGIGPGDEVITTPLSAAYSALAIIATEARPVFADIDPSRLTLDPRAIEAAITPRTAAIMPVHLYGQPADMPAILAIAERHGLAVVEDACQAHLATCDGRPVGSMGAAGALSFYPTKNLGALGDGGAVLTNDRALGDRIRRLRNGGQSSRYHHDEFGVNSRLDEMQAAILRARLTRLPAWTARRRAHCLPSTCWDCPGNIITSQIAAPSPRTRLPSSATTASAGSTSAKPNTTARYRAFSCKSIRSSRASGWRILRRTR